MQTSIPFIKYCEYIYTNGKYLGEYCVNPSLPGYNMCDKHHNKIIFKYLDNTEELFDKCKHHQNKKTGLNEKCNNRAILGMDLCRQHYEKDLYKSSRFSILRKY